MKGSIAYNDDQIDPKIVLNYLSTAETLSLSEFSRLTHFFLRQADKDDLTIDEKCLMATYLACADVIIPESKHHSCIGKRKVLQQYYFDNYESCSIETNRIIADKYKEYYDKKITQENEREEQFLGNYYPDIHDEIIELRKTKEKKKNKTRKHG